MFNPENPPALSVASWLNAERDLTLSAFKGKVVVLVAFQMLCGGSTKHALPQAQRIATSFQADEVQVMGLHMVFENFAEMTPAKLTSFVAEQGYTFPIGIDAPGPRATQDPPKTMTAYEIQGTPTILLFDRQGRLRRHYLGQVDDLRLGAEIMALSIEEATAPREQSIAIERRLHAALSDPHDHDHHGHEHGEACGSGCGHDHSHDHGHSHGHDHGRSHDAPRASVADALKDHLKGQAKAKR